MRQDRNQTIANSCGSSSRWMAEKERIENQIFRQSRITTSVTFSEGCPIITCQGRDKDDLAAFYVARKIVREMGYGEAKRGIGI